MGCSGFFTLGFTAVIVLGFIFKSVLFFYSVDEKLEQTMKLILTITDTKRIIKWDLCKKCRIEISIVKWVFFLIHGNILFQAVTSCTFNNLSCYLLAVLNATFWIPKLLYYMN